MLLTPHFLDSEFAGKSDRPLTDADWQHARALSGKLELMRAALGSVPLAVTSYIRTGDPGQHGDGTAVDVGLRPTSPLSQWDVYQRVTAPAVLASLEPFGQLIFYPFSDGHLHLALQTGTRRNEVLIADAGEKTYGDPTPGLLATIPG